MVYAMISQEKLYELMLDHKHEQEEKTDKINNYFVTLLSNLIAVTPFIDKATALLPGATEGVITRLFLTIISLIGLILSIIWSANIKRLLLYISTLDEKVIHIENINDIDFITYISNRLVLKNSPDRITKYQLIVPIYISSNIYLNNHLFFIVDGD